MADYKLDIFKSLSAIDNHNMDFYSSLSDEEKKGFAPSVILRWVSVANEPHSEWYIAMCNEINSHFFEIHDHPELQYKLIASCGVGRKTRHSWIPSSKSKRSDKLVAFISTYWKEASYEELKLILEKFDKKTFGDFVSGTGIDDVEAKKIKKLFADYKK